MQPHQSVPTPVLPYRLNRTYAITIGVVHLLGLLAFYPPLFSWAGLVVCLIGIHLFGQGITIGYHRLITHRSFKTKKWLEWILAILGICSLEDTPVRWATNHRMHHIHSDEIPDPHSPRVSFWWSHCGWLMFVNRQTYSLSCMEKYSRDLLKDPFYLWLEKSPFAQFYFIVGQIPILFFAWRGDQFVLSPAPQFSWFGFGPTASSAVQLGTSMVVWGGLVRVIGVWHITWSVNSLSHMFGYRNYETKEDSRNNWLVAILSVGEGWHNNHHEDPSAATVQHRWWELDISYYEIKLLEWMGLARDVIPIRKYRKGSVAHGNSTL